MSDKPYFDTCSDCGANLDPGERCDCGKPDGFIMGEPFDIKTRADIGAVSYSDEVREKFECGKRAEMATYDDAMIGIDLAYGPDTSVSYSLKDLLAEIYDKTCPFCGSNIPTYKYLAINKQLEQEIRERIEKEYEEKLKFLQLEASEQLRILLSKYWLTHSNDQVATQFGCNFVPNLEYQDKARAIIDINLELSTEQLNQINKKVIKDVMRNGLNYAI